jgi:hypothetical protein
MYRLVSIQLNNSHGWVQESSFKALPLMWFSCIYVCSDCNGVLLLPWCKRAPMAQFVVVLFTYTDHDLPARMHRCLCCILLFYCDVVCVFLSLPDGCARLYGLCFLPLFLGFKLPTDKPLSLAGDKTCLSCCPPCNFELNWTNTRNCLE